MNDIKKKIEKIIKKKMCDKGLKNCTYRQETVDAIEVLFEEEKRKTVIDMAMTAIDESDKSLVGLAEDLRRIFISDLTELEELVDRVVIGNCFAGGTFRDNDEQKMFTAGYKDGVDTCEANLKSWFKAKLQEIKAKYKY